MASFGKKIPEDELLWPGEKITTRAGNMYRVTQTRPNGRPRFTLWKVEAGGFAKLAVGNDNPDSVRCKMV